LKPSVAEENFMSFSFLYGRECMSAFRSFTIAVPEFRDKPEDLFESDRKTLPPALAGKPQTASGH